MSRFIASGRQFGAVSRRGGSLAGSLWRTASAGVKAAQRHLKNPKGGAKGFLKRVGKAVGKQGLQEVGKFVNKQSHKKTRTVGKKKGSAESGKGSGLKRKAVHVRGHVRHAPLVARRKQHKKK